MEQAKSLNLMTSSNAHHYSDYEYWAFDVWSFLSIAILLLVVGLFGSFKDTGFEFQLSSQLPGLNIPCNCNGDSGQEILWKV